jgi:hypothetical protein
MIGASEQPARVAEEGEDKTWLRLAPHQVQGPY